MPPWMAPVAFAGPMRLATGNEGDAASAMGAGGVAEAKPQLPEIQRREVLLCEAEKKQKPEKVPAKQAKVAAKQEPAAAPRGGAKAAAAKTPATKVQTAEAPVVKVPVAVARQEPAAAPVGGAKDAGR